MLAGEHIARRRHQERPCEICRGLCQHVRGVGEHDAASRRFCEIEVIVADSKVRHHFEAWRGIEQIRIESLRDQRETGILVCNHRLQGVTRDAFIGLPLLHVTRFAQQLHPGIRDNSRNQHFRSCCTHAAPLRVYAERRVQHAVKRSNLRFCCVLSTPLLPYREVLLRFSTP